MRAAQGRRGTLATTLLVGSLLILLAFTLVAANLFHLHLDRHLRESEQARNLAESALQTAIARLLDDPEFGTRVDDAVTVVEPEGSGQVVFAPGPLAHSRNNLTGDQAVAGWAGRLVPPNAVHLVGTARVGSTTEMVEAVLHTPPFPYALAAGGTISSRGGLLVAGAPEDLNLAELGPGNLVSNALDEVAAVNLTGPNIRVLGDVQAAGRVERGDSEIGGEVRAFADPIALPRFQLEDYDPLGRPGTIEVTQVTGPLEGVNRFSGPTLMVPGDLNLQEAVLYVDGDLQVLGGLKGRGAVFVTGATEIRGGSALSTDNQAALIGRGPISLSGEAGHCFQGMLYTEGTLVARNLRLLGSFVAAGPGAVSLDQVDLIGVSAYSHLSLRASDGTTLEVTVPMVVGTLRPITAVFRVRLDLLLATPYDAAAVMDDLRSRSRFTYAGNTLTWDELATATGNPPALATQLAIATEAALTMLQGQAAELQSQGQTGVFSLTLDLNRLLQPADRVRLLIWRQL